jgi:hypothetical protein
MGGSVSRTKRHTNTNMLEVLGKQIEKGYVGRLDVAPEE